MISKSAQIRKHLQGKHVVPSFTAIAERFEVSRELVRSALQEKLASRYFAEPYCMASQPGFVV